MSNLTPSDLRDPEPPTPGERERALVAERAHALGRRRRLVQGGGALALVAVVAVSVAALTGGNSGSGSNQVTAASAGNDTSVSAPASSVTTAPATVSTTVPAPTPDSSPAGSQTTPSVPTATLAPQTEVAPTTPVAPSTFSLSGSVGGAPAGATVTLTINGPGGEFTATADDAGNFAVSGLTAGDYTVIGQWTSGGASGAQRFGTVSVSGDSSASFTFSQ